VESHYRSAIQNGGDQLRGSYYGVGDVIAGKIVPSGNRSGPCNTFSGIDPISENGSAIGFSDAPRTGLTDAKKGTIRQ